MCWRNQARAVTAYTLDSSDRSEWHQHVQPSLVKRLLTDSAGSLVSNLCQIVPLLVKVLPSIRRWLDGRAQERVWHRHGRRCRYSCPCCPHWICLGTSARQLHRRDRDSSLAQLVSRSDHFWAWTVGFLLGWVIHMIVAVHRGRMCPFLQMRREEGRSCLIVDIEVERVAAAVNEAGMVVDRALRFAGPGNQVCHQWKKCLSDDLCRD